MKKILLIFLIQIFFLNTNVYSNINKFKKGDILFNEIKLSKKKSLTLPEGNWEVTYRSTEIVYGMKFSLISLVKLKNNKISEFLEIGFSNLAGKFVYYVDPIMTEIMFKNTHDGCYERPEYLVMELYRKGSTHNCFKIRHLETVKELYNPDDKSTLGFLASIKKYINDNNQKNLPKIMLGSFHSYFSRTNGGDWYLISHLINPKNINAPDSKFFTEESSEYHKYNIDNYPTHKEVMNKWISSSAKRHLELEKLAKANTNHRLNLEKYVLKDNHLDNSKQENNINFIDQLNKLNDLFKSGSLSKEEFEKAKRKLLE
jgi:hypothetical protein